MLGDCSPVKSTATFNSSAKHSSIVNDVASNLEIIQETSSSNSSQNNFLPISLSEITTKTTFVGSNYQNQSLEATTNQSFVLSETESLSSESIQFLSSESSSESNSDNEEYSDDEPGDNKNINSTTTSSSQESITFLKHWSLKNNVTHSAINELLQWFSTNPSVSNLPKDARTILQTPRQIDIKNMGDGSYHYFGLSNQIRKLFNKYEVLKHVSNPVLCVLDFNIDGLPIHKSTKQNFWPILCKISNYPKEPPFIVALYCGPSKPPLNEFFEDFVVEVNDLKINKLKITNHKFIDIECRSFCCDAPARAYVKATMSFNSYHGCDKCTVKGRFVRRMVFLDSSAPLRQDADFLDGKYGNYHKSVSPICALGVGMVSSFPVDYMHCVCLGVMRKLLFLWRDGSRLYRLTPEKLQLLENRLKIYKTVWPCEFNRQPRSLKELEHWKATEFRQFLLYITPLLGDILSNSVFSHMMLLKYGLTILLNTELNGLYNSYADNLLKLFVSHSVHIYGIEFCVYNVHALIHLAADAIKFGSLNNVNSFAFENYLGCLKRFLRKGNQSLQQICNRVYEGKEINVNYNIKATCVSGRISGVIGDKTFYPKLIHKDWTFSCTGGNSCVFLTDETIIYINNIYVENCHIFILGKKLLILEPFVSYPTNSSFMLLYKVVLSQIDITFSHEKIKCKGMLLPQGENSEENTYFCCPLIHGL